MHRAYFPLAPQNHRMSKTRVLSPPNTKIQPFLKCPGKSAIHTLSRYQSNSELCIFQTLMVALGELFSLMRPTAVWLFFFQLAGSIFVDRSCQWKSYCTKKVRTDACKSNKISPRPELHILQNKHTYCRWFGVQYLSMYSWFLNWLVLGAWRQGASLAKTKIHTLIRITCSHLPYFFLFFFLKWIDLKRVLPQIFICLFF